VQYKNPKFQKNRQIRQNSSKKEKKYFIEIVTTVPYLPLTVFIGSKMILTRVGNRWRRVGVEFDF